MKANRTAVLHNVNQASAIIFISSILESAADSCFTLLGLINAGAAQSTEACALLTSSI